MFRWLSDERLCRIIDHFLSTCPVNATDQDVTRTHHFVSVEQSNLRSFSCTILKEHVKRSLVVETELRATRALLSSVLKLLKRLVVEANFFKCRPIISPHHHGEFILLRSIYSDLIRCKQFVKFGNICSRMSYDVTSGVPLRSHILIYSVHHMSMVYIMHIRPRLNILMF